MKVLLLCMAFAAVSLAMPVAEENVAPAEPAALVPVAAAKAEELPQADEKKPDPAPVVNEPEKIPEPATKSAVVDVPAALPKTEIVEKEPVIETKTAASAEPEAEKKPDPSKPKTEDNLKPKPADQPEQDKPKLDDKTIPEGSAPQSVPLDVVNAANTNSGIASEPNSMDELSPSVRSEIPIASTNAEKVPEPKKEEVAAEPAKPEENKPEIKAEEKPAAPAPVELKDPTDAPRLVRDTVTEKPEAQAEPKLTATAEDKPKESDKAKEASDETSQVDLKPVNALVSVEKVDLLDAAVPTDDVDKIPAEEDKPASPVDTPIVAEAPTSPPAASDKPEQADKEKPATEQPLKPQGSPASSNESNSSESSSSEESKDK